MGDFAHSILNPINDISNIWEGTVHLFTNPSKQINKYILPAAEEALPAAAVAASFLVPDATGLEKSAAIGGAIGTYGSQLATEGIGKMMSGTPPSIGDFIGGVVGAGLGAGYESGELSKIGSDIANNPGITLQYATGLAGIGLTGYSIYAQQQAKSAQQKAQQQAQQQAQQTAQQQLCQELEGMTSSQLVSENWSAIVPNLSANCKNQLANNFSPKIIAAVMAAEKLGEISTDNLSALESILPAATINTATELFSNCSNYASSPTTFGECVNSSYTPSTGQVSTTSTGQVSTTSPYYPGTNVSTFSNSPQGTGNLGITPATTSTTSSQPSASSFPWSTVLLVGGGAVVVYIGYKLITD